MRVLLDVSALDQDFVTGTERALLHLLRHLAREQPADLDLHLAAPRPPRLLPPDLPFPLHRAWGGRAWREAGAPALARQLQADLWHSPVLALPLRARLPRVATIHEFAFLADPGLRDEGRPGLRRLRARWTARRAAALVCVSAWTEAGLLRLAPAARGRTRVIPHAVDAAFLEARPTREARETVPGLGPERPYLLAVARARRRKALEDLLPVLAALAEAGREEVLVLAGPPAPARETFLRRAAAAGLGDRVLAPGWIPEEHLPGLYAGAAALLLPSRSEGFGLPLLEAWAARTPVAARRAAALPEIAGEAALWLDFERPREAAGALLALLGDPARRRDLVEAGRRRLEAAHRPGEPARRLLALWREILAGGS